MRKNLLLAVLIIALMAVPAFASVQNIKVSGDIKESLVVRDGFDLGQDILGDMHQNVFLSQIRLRVDADLTDNVSAVVRLLNERDWGNSAQAEENVDVDLAYVEMREMLYSPLTVTLGRQVLYYGNGLIIGDGPNNATTTAALAAAAADLSIRSGVDAIKLSLDYDPLMIDVFAAKIAENISTQNKNADDDADLYGINATYKLSDKWNTSLEGYFFANINQNVTTLGNKADTTYVPGFRVSTNPIKGLNVSTELAWQAGTDADYPTAAAGPGLNARREAMAAQFIASYLLPFEKTAKYNPVAVFAYTYASGDSNPADVPGVGITRTTAWNPLYEGQSSGKIYNSIMNLTNVHCYEYSLQAMPVDDITAKLTWTALWLDKDIKSGTWTLTLPDAGTAAESVKTDKSSIGNEIDLDLTYDYTEDVSIGMSMGWFIPGNLFEDANDSIASQLLTSVNVAF